MQNREREYNNLESFIGKWTTEGTILPTANSPEMKLKGTDSYEWLPGGFFILHKVDVQVGSDHNQTFEIIGFDSTSNQYSMHYFDNKGNSGKMLATYQDGNWNFLGDNLRFTGRFSEDGSSLSGIWEQLTKDKNWEPYISIQLIKEYSH